MERTESMNEKKPLLSIIVPVYNVEKYLRECIRSIQMQSFRNYEVILVNDGSTDRSPEICEAYAGEDRRVRIIHSANMGVSSARNIGLDAAKGDYIYFIDSDDVLADRHVLLELMKFTKDPEVDLVAARGDHFYHGNAVPPAHTGKFTYQVITSDREARQFIAATLLMINIFSRRMIGDTRFDTRITMGEDILFLSHVIPKLKKAVLCERLCYHRRLRRESLSHSDFQEGYFKENRLFYKLIYRELHAVPGGDELFEKYYADQTGVINKLASKHRCYKKEKQIIRKRIARCFPHFLNNQYIKTPTKVFLIVFMLSPDLFYLLFKPYKVVKAAWNSLHNRHR